MALSFANNATSTLATDFLFSDTVLNVATGDGDKFPTPQYSGAFRLTITSALSAAIEIVECTARNGDALTVTRGLEGTVAATFQQGDSVENRITADSLGQFVQKPAIIEPDTLPMLDANGNIGRLLTADYIPAVRATTQEMQAGVEEAIRSMSPKDIADAIQALANNSGDFWEWTSAPIPATGAAAQTFAAAHPWPGTVPKVVSAVGVLQQAIGSLPAGSEVQLGYTSPGVPAHAQTYATLSASSSQVIMAFVTTSNSPPPQVVIPGAGIIALDSRFNVRLRARRA